MTNTTPSSRFDLYTVAALVLALVCFFLSLWISRVVFNRLPHLEDEMAYLYQAEVFAHGDLVIQSPVPARPFWKPFVVDHSSGTRFSKYTPGWSAWLSLGVLWGDPWIVNAFFGMLTVILVYKLGRAVFNPDVGLVAALLLTFAPIALLLNATIMSHTSALFFGTLFMYGYWQLEQAGRLRQKQSVSEAQTPVVEPASTLAETDEIEGVQARETTVVETVVEPVEKPDAGEGRLAGTLRRALIWGAASGLGLGMMITNRPLSALAIATPFVLWSIIRLGRVLWHERQQRWQVLIRTLAPLVLLAAVALVLALAIPVYNLAATGNPTTNLYTLVWSYDKVGFGEGYGKTGHTLEKGLQYAKYDLSLLAADLFGWQVGSFTKEIQQGLLRDDGFYPLIGLSWLLLLPGLLIGYRKQWSWLWGINVVIWLWWLSQGALDSHQTEWLLVGAALLFAPLIFVADDRDQRPVWTWLLMGIMVILITVHLAYWIGSQRYSTRYYYEMISGAVIISALPIAWVIRRLKRPDYKLGVYGVVLAVCLWSLVTYSAPRIDALRDFNRINPTLIKEVNARRTTDKPVLVLVSGDKGVLPSWRSYGALMAATNPYLDSDIIVGAYENNRINVREQILAAFPDREVIEMGATNAAGGDNAWFTADCQPDGTCPIANQPRQW